MHIAGATWAELKRDPGNDGAHRIFTEQKLSFAFRATAFIIQRAFQRSVGADEQRVPDAFAPMRRTDGHCLPAQHSMDQPDRVLIMTIRLRGQALLATLAALA